MHYQQWAFKQARLDNICLQKVEDVNAVALKVVVAKYLPSVL